MEKKQDLRVFKTQKALTEALITLLGKKPFTKITVNDICQNALVSRSTFYLHFDDKYQLLHSIIQNEQIQLLSKARDKEPEKFLLSFLETIKERKRFYRNLLFAEVDLELISMFQAELHLFFRDILSKENKFTSPPAIVAAYYASAVSGLILWWIKSDFKYSIDEMSEALKELHSHLLVSKT